MRPSAPPAAVGWHQSQLLPAHDGFKHPEPVYYPNMFPSFSDNMLRAAQSVSNITETAANKHIRNLHSSTASLGVEARGAQRAKGRTTAEKRQNDKQCTKCGKWYTTGPSIIAHYKYNAKNDVCT